MNNNSTKQATLMMIDDFVEKLLDYFEDTQDKPVDFENIYNHVNSQRDILEHKIKTII